MMILSVINQKGGTGKTTTAINLSAALANAGKKTLLLDMDSQASASFSLGIKREDLKPSTADVLFDEYPLEEAVRSTNIQRLSLLSGSQELAHSDLILADIEDRENILLYALERIMDEYDFIVCDCAPSLSMLPVNCLVASDAYLIPMSPEHLSMEGLYGLFDAVNQIKEGMEIEVHLLGILFTLVKPPGRFGFGDKETREHKKIMKLIRARFGRDVFDTVIERDVRLATAPAYGQTVFEYAPNSKGAMGYAKLAQEVLMRSKELLSDKKSTNQEDA